MTSTAAPVAPADTEASIAEIARLLETDITATAPVTPPTAGASGIQTWMAGLRGKNAALRHPRIALFACATHAAEIARLQSGKDALCALSEDINADLQVYELPAHAGSDRAAQLHAMTYGMMAVQPGVDALALASLDDSAQAPFANLDDLLASPRADLAAAMGTLIAARLARVPVFYAGAGIAAIIALMDKYAAGNTAHALDAARAPGAVDGQGDAIAAAFALGQAKYLATLASAAR